MGEIKKYFKWLINPATKGVESYLISNLIGISIATAILFLLLSKLSFLDSLKSAFDILFSLTGIVVAILTYKAAKETILQPVRTEVIKKQTDLLIDIITSLDEESSLLHNVDYYGITELNVFSSLKLCGVLFNEDEKIKNFIKEKGKSAIFIADEDGRIDAEIISSFEEKEQKSDDLKKYYLSAKEGKYKITILDLTGSYVDFSNKIAKLKENPFIPLTIKTLLEQLLLDVGMNIKVHLKEAVEGAVNESFKRSGNTIPNISGVFNNFNHNRLSHARILTEINSEIRKYLKIDSMP